MKLSDAIVELDLGEDTILICGCGQAGCGCLKLDGRLISCKRVHVPVTDKRVEGCVVV